MNTTEVDDSCRDLVSQFRGAIPHLQNEFHFETVKESYRNQLNGIAYVCRYDRNYPRIIQRHIDDLESIQYSAVGACLPAHSAAELGQGGNQ